MVATFAMLSMSFGARHSKRLRYAIFLVVEEDAGIGGGPGNLADYGNFSGHLFLIFPSNRGWREY